MTRYGFSLAAITSWPSRGVARTDGHGFAWGWLYRIEADAVVFADGIPGLTLLPGLQTAAGRLSAEALNFLAARGIVPQPGDTLLNLLRALRDAGGETGRSFDISSSD